MEYAILIHSSTAVGELFAAMDDDERKEAFQFYFDIESELEATGELVDSKAVEERTQQTVRRTATGIEVAPAPPLEDVAVLSGCYVVDVASIERAHEISARFPEAAVEGGIRVARVLTQEDFDEME